MGADGSKESGGGEMPKMPLSEEEVARGSGSSRANGQGAPLEVCHGTDCADRGTEDKPRPFPSRIWSVHSSNINSLVIDNYGTGIGNINENMRQLTEEVI